MPQLPIPTFDDPEALRTLEVAALLGHDLLVQVFVDAAFSKVEAESLAGDVLREVFDDSRVEDHRSGDVLELLEVIDRRMTDHMQKDPVFADIVARADGIVDPDVFTAGSVSDGVRLGRSIALAMVLLLGISKLEGSYDWKTGDGYIALGPGIPEGFADSVRALGTAVSSRLQPPRPAEKALPKPPDEGGKPRLPEQRSNANVDDQGGPQRTSNRQLLPETDRQHAEELANDLINRFKSGLDLADIQRMSPDELFVSKDDILRNPSLESDWISIGAGIQPTNAGKFIIALRIQSRRYLRPRVWNRIREFYREAFGSIVSVRWVGPVELAASNPHGDWRPWRGAHNKFGIGSPINVAGGRVGTVGLIVKNDRYYYALTMGHVLADCHADAVGMTVYFTPQPFTAASTNAIGVVERAEICPSVSPFDRTTRIVPHDRLDFGLVRLNDGSVPNQDGRLKVGSRSFSSIVHILDPHTDRGASTLKSAARSKETSGTITAFNVAIEAVDHVRGGAVRIERAVEIELDVESRIVPGDSGALVCVDRDGTLKPFGLCVAGARRSKIQTAPGSAKSVVYVLPLTDLLRQIGEPEIC
jgi:hypothetical protein